MHLVERRFSVKLKINARASSPCFLAD